MRALYATLGALLGMVMGLAFAADRSIGDLPYPDAVALSQENGKWIFKTFPQLLPLYVFDGETAGRSTCNAECTAVWPIVLAEQQSKPSGLWTPIKRDDGRYQWAFRGRPVYTYFEDSPNDRKGVGKDQDWYRSEAAYAYLAKVGVHVSAPPAVNTMDRKPGNKRIIARALEP